MNAGDEGGPDLRRAPAVLRWIAARLIRGPEAGFVLDDLDVLYAHDVERRGMSPARAGGRYVRNAVASALTLRRAERRRRGARVSLLDIKLGLRMLLRYPGLAAVAVLSMAVGIALGTGYLEIVHDFTSPELPLEDGDRIVGIRVEDLETSGTELRSLHDFLVWREELVTVRDLGAFRTVERNLVVGTDGLAEPITVAEISPAAFRITRTPPLLGRTLVEADARTGAPPVVVLGHEVWAGRFGGGPGIVGRTVRLGGEEAVVVGVMPEGFGFPRSHRLWTPLRPDALTPGPPEPRQGPAIQVFGRLAPGASLEDARAEVATLGGRMAADLPGTHARLRPRVVPYIGLFAGGGPSTGLYLLEAVFVALLALISANVATLVFARTATREGEIAVRSALGASRFRIVAQLFVEALVLALTAAALGLVVAGWVVRWLADLFWTAIDGRAPFWWDDGLAPETLLLALGLAVLAASVVGVLPALRATRGSPGSGLQRTARGASLRLGGVWTGMLVFQVACAVALLPLGVDLVWRWAGTEAAGLGFPAEEYLAARLEMDAAGAAVDPRTATSVEDFRALYEELERRLEAEPEVVGVTFASALPGTTHRSRVVAVEGDAEASTRVQPRVGFQVVESEGGGSAGPRVQVAFVAPDFFEALGVEVVAGRAFQGADAGEGAADRVLIANQRFVDGVLGGRNAVGRRVRFVTTAEDDEEPWLEIVGVVENVATDPQGLDAAVPPALYRPLSDEGLGGGAEHAVHVAVHVRGDPGAFAPRLRGLASAVDPELRLYDPLPLDRPAALARGERAVNELIVWTVAVVALLALLISAAGTYSLMSFTVARRTREIGIRAALGADPRRLVGGIFAGALRRLLVGITVGTLGWLVPLAWLRSMQPGESVGGPAVGILLVVAALLLGTGLLACGMPARRALRVEPTDALRES